MNEPDTCPTCGTPSLDGDRAGPCPCCLLSAALAEGETVDFAGAGGNPWHSGPPAPREVPSTLIDRYRLIEEIGEGGFAIVYLAEQTAPVIRKVALKIVKPGMDTREVVARFEAERQTLALMDHPNIAQVYDGGSTGFLRPYFVMELVNGQPLTKYCDEARFSVRQRLELMLDVLSAVQHAHQKGIIHRDLKPSNILVSTHDGKPVVKVIDFGIAKALGGERTGRTAVTSHGRMIGTPEYMSPEQAGSHALDVDTRSDVYSLGVVLYELLTGRTPLDAGELRAASHAEIQRLIREVEPPRPSARLRASTGNLPEVARRRRTEPWKLRLQVRGDLDWIVMKTLEKDRRRRYPSTSGLAAELQRYLDDKPVTARPPGLGYLFGKYARRNKVGFAFIALVAMILVSATVFSLREAAHARLAEAATRESLRTASLSEARALRNSGQPGRRFRALESLATAARIRPGSDLRDDAISLLGVADLQDAETWPSGVRINDLAAVAPDFSSYASSQPDGSVTVFDLAGRNALASLPGSGVPVNWVLRFSPDSRILAIGHAPEGSGSVHVTFWDWKNNLRLGEIDAVSHSALDFSPDGPEVAAGIGSMLVVVDPRTGERVRAWDCLRDLPYSLRFRPDGKAVAVSSLAASTVTVVALESGGVSARGEFTKPRGIDWHRDQRRLAVACVGEISIWDTTKAGGKVSIPIAPMATIDRVAWSHATELLASSGWQQPVAIHDGSLGETLISINGEVKDLRFSGDDRRLGLKWNGTRMGLFEVADGHVARHAAGNGDYLRGSAWHSSDGVLATISDSALRFWNHEMRGIGGMEIPDGSGRFVAFTPGGLVVVAGSVRRHACRLEGTPPVLRLGAAEILDGGPAWQSATTTPDGRWLAAAGRDRVAMFDLRNPGKPVEIGAHPKADQAVLSPNGEWVATATYYGTGVKVWSVADGSLLAEFPAYERCRVSFSHDGQWLVAGTGSAYHFHRTGTWEREKSIACELGNDLGWVSWSPRNTVLMLAPEDFSLSMYDAKSLSLLASPQLDRQRPLGFNRSGSLLVTTDPRHRVHLWNLSELRKFVTEESLDTDLLFPPLPAAKPPLVEAVVLGD